MQLSIFVVIPGGADPAPWKLSMIYGYYKNKSTLARYLHDIHATMIKLRFNRIEARYFGRQPQVN